MGDIDALSDISGGLDDENYDIGENFEEEGEEVIDADSEDDEETEETEEHEELAEKETIIPIGKKDGAVKIIIIHPSKRKTDLKLQQPEFARAIAIRAEQISKNPTVFTNCEGIDDPIERAKKELYDRKSPLKIRRIVEKNREETIIWCEEFNLREMVLPNY
jgi:DNA-directed RNA polymerases I, II, and III subunit RPABC2